MSPAALQRGHRPRSRLHGAVLLGLALGLSLAGADSVQAQHDGHDHAQHLPGPSASAPANTLVLLAPGVDARQPVDFPPALAAHTLSNMRDHLLALAEIQQALAAAQFDVAARVAEQRLGMSSLQGHGAHEVARHMPPGMQAAGVAMHRSASRFAIEVQDSAASGDLGPTLAALATLTRTCVACHAGYRLR